MTPFLSNPRLAELARREPTPFYAYDFETIRASYRTLARALPDDFTVLYSMKANPHPAILDLVRDLGAWIDVASIGELQKATAAGFESSKTSFVGPGKSLNELNAIVKRDLFCTVVESLDEVRLLNEIAGQESKKPRICLRVNPDMQVFNSGQDAKSPMSQFGIDEEQLEMVLRESSAFTNIEIIGFHFFLRSQYLDARRLLTNFKRFLAIASRAERFLNRPVKVVNLGGGFGIPYFKGQSPIDLDEFRGGLQLLMNAQLGSSALRQARFFVESGRFIVAAAGAFVTKILYRKRSRDKTILVCDGGMTQNLSAIGFGQAIRRNFPVALIPQAQGMTVTEEEIVTIAGPSCYSVDILARDVQLPRAMPGDYLCFGNAGAYGRTFSPVDFLSQTILGEIVLTEN